MSKFSPEKLHSLREYHQLTQEAIAEICGVDSTTVSGWEKGKWEPSLQNALSLSGALHISVEDLCDIEETIDFSKVANNSIGVQARELSLAEQEFILEMISGLKALRHLF